ncbi:hypothetical protein D3C76_1242050 [compost metagenome]
MEALIGLGIETTFALGIGQAVHQPGIVRVQHASLAQGYPHLRPIAAPGSAIGLRIEAIQRQLPTHALELLLFFGRQAVEVVLGLFR